jgi:hypothetical protein
MTDPASEPPDATPLTEAERQGLRLPVLTRAELSARNRPRLLPASSTNRPGTKPRTPRQGGRNPDQHPLVAVETRTDRLGATPATRVCRPCSPNHVGGCGIDAHPTTAMAHRPSKRAGTGRGQGGWSDWDDEGGGWVSGRGRRLWGSGLRGGLGGRRLDTPWCTWRTGSPRRHGGRGSRRCASRRGARRGGTGRRCRGGC